MAAALLVRCACEWHAGLLHYGRSDSVTHPSSVILHIANDSGRFSVAWSAQVNL